MARVKLEWMLNSFDLVAVFNEDEEKYHVYITNIPKDF